MKWGSCTRDGLTWLNDQAGEWLLRCESDQTQELPIATISNQAIVVG